MTVEKYRNKHKRCATCVYFKDNYYANKRSCTAKGIITKAKKRQILPSLQARGV